MKVQLREHVRVAGEGNTRNVEVARIDWGKRVLFLPSGQWVPFENVAIGEPEVIVVKVRHPSGKMYDAIDAPGRNGTIVDVPRCDRCQKTFPTGSALGGHRRHCK